MDHSRVRFIDMVLLGLALIAMLLTTPSIHAKSSKRHVKKVKITFDGTSSGTSSSGELGDEIPAPRIQDRDARRAENVVRLRSNSVDDLWMKNTDQREENPDLAEPVAKLRAAPSISQRAHANTKGLLAHRPSVDESALGSFKKSRKVVLKKTAIMSVAKKVSAKKDVNVAAKPDFRETPSRVRSAPTQASAQVEFDEIKSVPAKTPARPVTRTFLKDSIPVATANHLATSVRAERASEFTFNFAFENTVTLGRKYQLETLGDRNYAMKNEVFVGANHSSGWGAKISGAFASTSNDDTRKNISGAGDASLIVSHPSWLKTRDLDVYGRARYYAPTSTSSRLIGLHHFAYYLLADFKLPSDMIVSNAFIPRYFVQKAYADADAFSLLFDSTEITKTLGLVRLGFGQQSQIESHQATAPGTTIEAYPFIDFLGLSNALLEAKLYVPLYVDGAVGGAPTSVGLSNIQAEFFAKLSW